MTVMPVLLFLLLLLLLFVSLPLCSVGAALTLILMMLPRVPFHSLCCRCGMPQRKKIYCSPGGQRFRYSRSLLLLIFCSRTVTFRYVVVLCSFDRSIDRVCVGVCVGKVSKSEMCVPVPKKCVSVDL